MDTRLLMIAALGALTACGGGNQQEYVLELDDEIPTAEDIAEFPEATSPQEVTFIIPDGNARRGRILFITNGCVLCHEINGVGGKAAPALGMPAIPGEINPVKFSAQMWAGAEQMMMLQSLELGYVIDLDEEDIADLAAFTASPSERALLTPASVPAEMKSWFIDENRWTEEEWEEFKARGERIPLD